MNYKITRATQELIKVVEGETSSDSDATSLSTDDEDEQPRRDDLEISFIDLTPQFATLSANI